MVFRYFEVAKIVVHSDSAIYKLHESKEQLDPDQKLWSPLTWRFTCGNEPAGTTLFPTEPPWSKVESHPF